MATEEKIKKRVGGFILILCGLVSLIVALCVANWSVYNNLSNNEEPELSSKFGALGSEQLKETVDYYLNSDDSNTTELMDYLKNSILPGEISSAEQLSACYYLAALKERFYSVNDAISEVMDCLDNSMVENDAIEIALLSYLLKLYEQSNDVDGQIATLNKLVVYPDSTSLVGENWPVLKKYYAELLNRLEDNRNG